MNAIQLSAYGTCEDVFGHSKNSTYELSMQDSDLIEMHCNLIKNGESSAKDMFSLRPIRNANKIISFSGNQDHTFPGTEIFSISQREEAIAHSLKGGKVLFDLRSM